MCSSCAKVSAEREGKQNISEKVWPVPDLSKPLVCCNSKYFWPALSASLWLIVIVEFVWPLQPLHAAVEPYSILNSRSLARERSTLCDTVASWHFFQSNINFEVYYFNHIQVEFFQVTTSYLLMAPVYSLLSKQHKHKVGTFIYLVSDFFFFYFGWSVYFLPAKFWSCAVVTKETLRAV